MKIRFLNSNAIKLIAIVLMTIDHIGFLFFPFNMVYRTIGRIAFPMFAFLLAEGCHYTKDRFKHFSFLFVLGVVFQVVYEIATGDKSEYNVFLTFALSVLCIYTLDFAKANFTKAKPIFDKILGILLFFATVFAVYMLSTKFPFDYGFAGIMAPVVISLTDNRELPKTKVTEILSSHYVKLVLLLIATVFLVKTSAFPTNIALFAFLSTPILFFYNGKKGKLPLKYFFYIYYPAHLVILAGISELIYLL